MLRPGTGDVGSCAVLAVVPNVAWGTAWVVVEAVGTPDTCHLEALLVRGS